jgi:hypothetical protein
MGDRQAFEQARMKMKSEATPPPNAPRKVTRRVQLPMENASSAETTQLVTPATSAQPAKPSPAARASIGPTETPDVSPASTPTPTMTPFPQRSHTMAPNSTLQRTFPSPSVPLTTGSNQPQASPAGAPTRFGRGAAKEDRKADRQLRREEGSTAQPAATIPPSNPAPPASPTPAATAPPSFSGREQRKEERKEDRRARRAGGTSESASPSPTAP